MRLIDAEKLIEEFSGTGSFDAVEVRRRIAYAPTEFDTNKVLKQLEELANKNGNAYLECADVIEIVKSGVKK